MHLVLRSTKAKGDWSFRSSKNERKIRQIVDHFSSKYGIKIHSLANVGNHLHFHIKLGNRQTYKPFIRAITSAIAMAVTGASRWNKVNTNRGNGQHLENGGHSTDRLTNRTNHKSSKNRFWDYRPFTRVVRSFKALLNLRDYIRINELEGYGYKRDQARFILAWNELTVRGADTS